MGGSKGSAPTPSGASTTSSTSSQGTSQGVFAQGPSAFVSPMYQDFLTKAQGLSSTPFNPQTQSTVAPLNTQQTSGLNQLFNLGMDMGNFHPEQVQAIMSPYIQDVVGASQDWFNNQNAIQGNSLLGQGIRSGNAFGGDRMGVAAAEMAGQQQLAQAPVIAGLYQSGYTQALDEYNRLKQFGIQGAEEAVKAGTVGQAQSQRELDVATQNAMMKEAYPFQLANWYGSALGGVGPLTGTVGSAQSATTSSTEGITNPPTPNPLNQALGIGSSLVGIGGGLGLFKEGGRVPHFEDGGFLGSYNEDDDDEGRDRDEGGADPEQQAPDSSSEISPKTGKPLTDYERELKVIGEAGTPEPVESNLGVLKVKKFKQPYSILDKLKNASGGGGGGSSSASTGSTQPSAPAAAKEPASSGAGKTIGAIGGTILGGPVGGAIGGAVGSLAENLFQDGGPVEADDEEEDEDNGEEEFDAGDTGDTGDAGEPPVVQVAQVEEQPAPQVVQAAMPTTPAAQPAPGGEQAPSWLGPGMIAQPETRRPAQAGMNITERRDGPARPTAPEPEPPTADAADRGGYSVQRIPELGPPPKTFAQRWATNPFTQLGMGMLSNTSPHFGPGLAAGVGAATNMIQRERKQDLLDAKPQIMTQGDTISYRVGDQIIKTTIPTQTRGQKEAIKVARERTAAKGPGGRQASPEVMDRHIQTQLRMGAKTNQAAVDADPDWSGRPLAERQAEARTRAAEQWNQAHPKYQVVVPPRPEKPVEPEVKPAGPGVVQRATDAAVPVLKKAWEGFKSDAEKGYNVITTGKEEGNAAPAAPPQKPAAPAAPAVKNPIADALKSGATTKEKVKEEAREKLKTTTDEGKRQIIFQRLRENGIDFGDLISAPQPNTKKQQPELTM